MAFLGNPTHDIGLGEGVPSFGMLDPAHMETHFFRRAEPHAESRTWKAGPSKYKQGINKDYTHFCTAALSTVPFALHE